MKIFILLALFLSSCARLEPKEHWFMREGVPLPPRAEQEKDFAECAKLFPPIQMRNNCLFARGYGREVVWK